MTKPKINKDRSEMTRIELIDAMLERPIAFHRVFFYITQDVKAALFLSQAYYWSKSMKHDWFYKTSKSWQEETGLTWEEQKRVRKLIDGLGILSEELKGIPATMHFKFNMERFIELAEKYYSEQKELEKYPDVEEIQQIQEIPEARIRGFQKRVSGDHKNAYQGNPDTNTENKTENKTEKKITTKVVTKSPALVENKFFHEIAYAYNKILPELAPCKHMPEHRQQAIREIISCFPEAAHMKFWEDYFHLSRENQFFAGRNSVGWIANFDFFLKMSTVVKVDEGAFKSTFDHAGVW